MVFIMYCIVDVRLVRRLRVRTCLKKDVVRHEFVGHLRENFRLQGEVLRLARLIEGE